MKPLHRKYSVNDSFDIPARVLPYVGPPMTFKYLETLIPSPKPSLGRPVRFLIIEAMPTMGTRVYWPHGVGHCAEYLPCASFRELDVRGEQPGLFGSLSHPQLPEHYPSQERHRPWNLCFRQSSEQGQQGRHTSPNDGGGDQAPAHAHGRLARKRGNQVQPEALHFFFMLLLCCLRCVCSCLEVCLELPRGTGYYFQALYCHSPDLGQPQPGVVITPLSLCCTVVCSGACRSVLGGPPSSAACPDVLGALRGGSQLFPLGAQQLV